MEVKKHVSHGTAVGPCWSSSSWSLNKNNIVLVIVIYFWAEHQFIIKFTDNTKSVYLVRCVAERYKALHTEGMGFKTHHRH